MPFTTAFVADAIAPQLVVTIPGADTTAPRNAQLQIRFDEPVQSTNLGGIQLLAGGSPLPFTLALSDGNRTVTLTPSTLLAANTQHVMTVDGVRDTAGNEMGAMVVTTFHHVRRRGFRRTVADGVLPTDGTMDVPVNTTVAVTFDETINPLSALVPGSIRLYATNTVRSSRPAVTTGFELTHQAGNRPSD